MSKAKLTIIANQNLGVIGGVKNLSATIECENIDQNNVINRLFTVFRDLGFNTSEIKITSDQ